MRICFPFLLLAFSCSNPYHATNKVYRKQAKELAATIRRQPQGWQSDSMIRPAHWAGTVNFNLRKPNYIVIHHTAQNSCEQTIRTFQLSRTQVSAHYVICKDGTVHHMLNDYLRAWHAGAGSWGGNTDVNSSSIGIELDNNGYEPFPEAQVNSLAALLKRLKASYSIPDHNIIAHADLAPRRKNDPNIHFPWKQLAGNGLGRWYADTTGVEVPEGFSHWQALRLIGYDVSDSTAAMLAFKRHYMQDSTATADAATRKILYTMSK